MPEVEEYLDLIPAQHRQQPKFIAMVELRVGVQVHVQELLASMIAKFDVDLALGDQLDIIGQWVGVSRDVNIPIEGIYFSWDGSDPYVGWDFGNWQPENAPTAITSLPDDSYRSLVKAKIAANKWDGTTEGAYDVWDEVFTDLNILIQDHQDMSYDLIVMGGIVDSLTQALITGGYIPLKPEGVRVRDYYFPIDSGPLFGWNIESDFIQGWGEGSWARRISPT